MPSPVFALKVWLCVWPLVTLLTAGLRSLSWELPLIVQAMAVSGILVPLMVYVVIPFLNARKIRPKGDAP
jgi:antibiotic biosynthesis monooxygenase (ABM) superfamily enzyme